jgi:hypothetical protein
VETDEAGGAGDEYFLHALGSLPGLRVLGPMGLYRTDGT